MDNIILSFTYNHFDGQVTSLTRQPSCNHQSNNKSESMSHAANQFKGCWCVVCAAQIEFRRHSPHTSGPKPVRSNFIRVVQIRVRSSVGGWDAVLFSRCPSHRRTELRTCARVRCKYLSDSWKSTRSLKLQRKFAFGMLFAPFRQLHFKKINCTI